MNTGESILSWYQKNKRDLPWRRTHEAYAILVSEMMLQQTQVETVIGYYSAFMQRFPNVTALANADETEVLNYWQGLGYYNRARNLHRSAKLVMEQYGGKFPQTYEELIALPGVGPYIAGAVTSIAYNQPYSAVDGNVLRVVSRLFGIREDISKASVHRKITIHVKDMMPSQHAGDFTQALMELGALICKPISPDCAHCPVSTQCVAYREDAVQCIPVKKPKNKQRTVRLWVVAVQTSQLILLEYRKNETLLAKMWGLPIIEQSEDLETRFLDKFAVALKDGKHIGHVTHVFTHQRWEMDIVEFCLSERVMVGQELEWVDWGQLDKKPIPTAFKKVLDIIKKERCKD